jgi:hypothetical protein
MFEEPGGGSVEDAEKTGASALRLAFVEPAASALPLTFMVNRWVETLGTVSTGSFD